MLFSLPQLQVKLGMEGVNDLNKLLEKMTVNQHNRGSASPNMYNINCAKLVNAYEMDKKKV